MKTLLSEHPCRRLYRVTSEEGASLILREHFPPDGLDAGRLQACIARGLIVGDRLRRAPHPGFPRVLQASGGTSFRLLTEEVPGSSLETALTWRRQKTPAGQALDWVDDLLTVLLHLRHRVGIPCRYAVEFDRMVLTPEGRLVLVDPGWDELLWEDDLGVETESEFLETFYAWVKRLQERLNSRAPPELSALLEHPCDTTASLAHALRARRLETLEFRTPAR